ncbi:MAG: alpha,alpha-trehalase, partial [Bacteroidia bacterium]|nr:alpha,alpha-trehalase [Bacteroidia bacterium]
RFVYLLELGKTHKYDGEGIVKESPFLIQDTLLNALLIKSNQSLLNLAQRFGYEQGELKEWLSEGKRNFREKLWNEELNFFVPYDLRTGTQLMDKEIGGLVSLFAEVANDAQISAQVAYLNQLHQRGFYLCPSFDVDSPSFDSKRYWRGPVWPQMNWLVYKGLLANGEKEMAQQVSKDLIELVNRLGFHEYFEPQKSLAETLTKGYGGNNFSWTSASFIDLVS